MTRNQVKDQIEQLSILCKNIKGLVTVLTKRKNLSNLKIEIYNQTDYLNQTCKITERLYHIAYNLTEIPKCKTCKTKLTKFTHFNKGYREHCGIKCAQKSDTTKKKREQTTLKKYGVRITSQSDQVKEKMKQNNIEKFGGVAPIHSQEVKDKMTETNLKRYGVKSPIQNKEIKNKIIQTNLKRYGVINPLQNQEIKNKMIQTNLKKYGVRSTTQIKSVKEKQMKSSKKTNYDFIKSSKRIGKEYSLQTTFEEYCGVKYNHLKFIHKKCNTTFKYSIANGRFPRCPKCFPINESIGEEELKNFCSKYFNHEQIIFNTKNIISPLELDIYIPEINLAIEYNGLYWHSEVNGKYKNYHLNKTKLCNEKDIQLVHIFEDEWIDKKEIIKSILLNKFNKIKNRIFARKCQIGEISNIEGKQFLFDNHLQGFVNGIHYGLTYEDKLVSLITVGKSRFDKSNSIEIYRFCSLLDYQIVGGLSRLVKHVERKLKPKKIVTYADLRFGVGKGYLTSGFQFESITQPNYYYIKGQKRESRMKFQKHKLEKELNYFDSNLTESQNMFENGYEKVWDCGNVKFSQKIG